MAAFRRAGGGGSSSSSSNSNNTSNNDGDDGIGSNSAGLTFSHFCDALYELVRVDHDNGSEDDHSTEAELEAASLPLFPWAVWGLGLIHQG